MKKSMIVSLCCVMLCVNSVTYGYKKFATSSNTKPYMVTAPTPALLMQIDAYNNMNSNYSNMKQDMQNVLDNFKSSSDYGEIKLQKVMELLSAELGIVNCLLMGQTGYAIEKAVNNRNCVLQGSMPSVAYMYDKIINLATNDESTNQKLYGSDCLSCCQLAGALCTYDKKQFLLSMRSKLEHYQAVMRSLQCECAVASSSARNGVVVNCNRDTIDFCPVIR